jgi:hypothetical protein
MPLREAIDAYHELLGDDLAAESQAQLDDQLRRRGLFFGDRALCTVLRPRLLTPEQYRSLHLRTRGLMSAFRKAFEAAIADADFRAQFGLTDWEEELVRADPGFREPSPTSRMDAFFAADDGELRVIEYNAETPAGQAYGDVLTDAFYGLPLMREYVRRFDVRSLPARPGLLHVLTGAYEQFCGR